MLHQVHVTRFTYEEWGGSAGRSSKGGSRLSYAAPKMTRIGLVVDVWGPKVKARLQGIVGLVRISPIPMLAVRVGCEGCPSPVEVYSLLL